MREGGGRGWGEFKADYARLAMKTEGGGVRDNELKREVGRESWKKEGRGRGKRGNSTLIRRREISTIRTCSRPCYKSHKNKTQN